MDSIVHFENEHFVGRTNFHSGLLNSLIVLAIKDVDGVAHMCTDAWKFRRIFNRSLRHGVDVKFDYDGVIIDVIIYSKIGFSAADVCYRVQESVIDTVSGLVEDKVKNVNVKIVGVVNSGNGIQSKEVS